MLHIAHGWKSLLQCEGAISDVRCAQAGRSVLLFCLVQGVKQLDYLGEEEERSNSGERKLGEDTGVFRYRINIDPPVKSSTTEYRLRNLVLTLRVEQWTKRKDNVCI